jgi:hypothetical protein
MSSDCARREENWPKDEALRGSWITPPLNRESDQTRTNISRMRDSARSEWIVASRNLSTWPCSRHLGQVTKRRRRGQLSARLVHKKMRSDVTLSWRLAQQLLLRLWRRFWEHSQDRISAARVSDTRPSRCWSSPLPRNGCPAVP